MRSENIDAAVLSSRETEFIFLFCQLIYRIKLPGPAILGEGKPENQNHAIIFTRGEGLQTIDMNQVHCIVFFCLRCVLKNLILYAYD